MNILILHHLEPCWDSGLQRYGSSFELQCEKVEKYLSQKDIDKIIITQFELCQKSQNDSRYWLLFNICAEKEIKIKWQEYPYALTKDSFNEDEESIRFCEGGNHSEVVLLDNWMRELNGNLVYLGGCFDGECLEDIQIALDYLDIKYQRVLELIV